MNNKKCFFLVFSIYVKSKKQVKKKNYKKSPSADRINSNNR